LAVLCCAVLCCVVLHCTALHCTNIFNIRDLYTVLYHYF
jgi:hypothetical protein